MTFCSSSLRFEDVSAVTKIVFADTGFQNVLDCSRTKSSASRNVTSVRSKLNFCGRYSGSISTFSPASFPMVLYTTSVLVADMCRLMAASESACNSSDSPTPSGSFPEGAWPAASSVAAPACGAYRRCVSSPAAR